MPSANGLRLRNFVFTINNPVLDENADHVPPSWDPVCMSYLGYALERGTSGTIHWQGYCELRSQKTLQSIKILIGGSPHIERRHGTAQQARDYFALPGDKPGESLGLPVEHGVLSKQGKRSDLDAVVESVKVCMLQA
ncbi:MAG: hypothetical protein EOO61_05925 [Hymenobacter sp.]|nr:MAG: hypothetical protein EOO61_05925 [Hymenobacter sp.]